jgi:hypothetical protein
MALSEDMYLTFVSKSILPSSINQKHKLVVIQHRWFHLFELHVVIIGLGLKQDPRPTHTVNILHVISIPPSLIPRLPTYSYSIYLRYECE